jgi:hypothetical protein
MQTISFNRTRSCGLINDADLFGNAAPSYFSNDRSYVLGWWLGSFWGYEYAGVYQGTDFRQVHKRLQVVWRESTIYGR